MKVSYARSELPQSIFLAGPTSRSKPVIPSWRPEAVAILERLGFDGTVFVPEDGDGSSRFSYDDQIEWELQALHSATVIVFWVPRDYIENREMLAILNNLVEDLRDPEMGVQTAIDSIEAVIKRVSTCDMPALTTNVEFGHFINRGNIAYGHPATAKKMKYLDGLAFLNGNFWFDSLEQTLQAAIKMCERPFPTSPNYNI